MPNSFLAQWKQIKKDFEAATGKKKPSDKFLGVTNKKTKLEPSLTSFDTALKTKDTDAAKKAYDAVETAATAYQAVLFKAAAAEKDKDIKMFTTLMTKQLSELLEDAEESWKTVAEVPTFSKLNDLRKYMRTPNGDRLVRIAEKNFDDEPLKFLLALIKKESPEKIYKRFIATNEINVISDFINGFKENLDDLEKGPWEKTTGEVLKMVNYNLVSRINSKYWSD